MGKGRREGLEARRPGRREEAVVSWDQGDREEQGGGEEGDRA